MYTLQTIQAAFLDYVGFRQTINTDYDNLVSDLTQPESGEYVNDMHPLITTRNIYAIEDFEAVKTAAWSITTTYLYGQRVTYSGSMYRALAGNVGQQPDISPNDWKETNVVSDFLYNIMDAAVSSIMAELFVRKKVPLRTKSLFEQVYLFNGPGTLTNKEVKLDRFVGFEINLQHFKDVAILIKRIGLQLDTAQTIPMYLFHSSKQDPVWQQDVVVGDAIDFNWYTPTIEEPVLKYVSDTEDSGGTYYFGYFESDLTGQAIVKDFDFSKPVCSTCNPLNTRYYSQYSRFIDVNPIYVPNALLNGTQLWDIDNNRYVNDNNFGINLQLNAGCDIDSFVLQNKNLFAEAIKTNAALGIIRAMAYGQETSGDSEKLKQAALYEISNDNKLDSLVTKAERALNALINDVSGLRSPCLAGNTRKGISFRSA